MAYSKAKLKSSGDRASRQYNQFLDLNSNLADLEARLFEMKHVTDGYKPKFIGVQVSNNNHKTICQCKQ
jgi:hypothetical protein